MYVQIYSSFNFWFPVKIRFSHQFTSSFTHIGQVSFWTEFYFPKVIFLLTSVPLAWPVLNFYRSTCQKLWIVRISWWNMKWGPRQSISRRVVIRLNRGYRIQPTSRRLNTEISRKKKEIWCNTWNFTLSEAFSRNFAISMCLKNLASSRAVRPHLE